MKLISTLLRNSVNYNNSVLNLSDDHNLLLSQDGRLWSTTAYTELSSSPTSKIRVMISFRKKKLTFPSHVRSTHCRN